MTAIEPGHGRDRPLVRTRGDQGASDTLHAGAQPMTADDIAGVIHDVATPPHLDINRLESMPVTRSVAGFLVPRGG